MSEAEEDASRVDASDGPPFCVDMLLCIFARLPSSKYCDLRWVSPHFASLIRSGEVNAIRRVIGLKEPKIFLDLGEARYQCYEPYARSCWNLPVCPYDDETTPYHASDLFCVGTHLLMLGITDWNYGLMSCEGTDIWRYELELNQWFNGPMMITPRYAFASADCGSVACVAGGQQVSQEVLNSAEKYNPESKSWESLPSMNKRRKLCSGFYMDSKFYVIGGRDENHNLLACGECYDFERNVWEVIPNMMTDYLDWTINSSEPQDFMAVVNNELYHFDVRSRRLKVYLKNNNTWKIVGRVPASIEHFQYWGVELKSLGEELLLVYKTQQRDCSILKILMCFCTPSPELDDVEWRVLDFSHQEWHHSNGNCCVMMA